VQHSEALLLINYHQPQILEGNVVLHQPVRANDDIDGAGRQLLKNELLLARGAKAG